MELQATNFNGSSSSVADGYDLITFFDCFHDMPDPYSVAKHTRNALKPDGTCMIVEMAWQPAWKDWLYWFGIYLCSNSFSSESNRFFFFSLLF
jgi:2-polyprenyl-3-methyl-5-hydroxy-6-metoxy-1,4-benzoquinol methylase